MSSWFSGLLTQNFPFNGTMFTSFSHQDVRDHWRAIELRQDILCEEWNYDQFLYRSSEFHLWLFCATADPQIDMLRFWVSCLGIEGLDPLEIDPYLASGAVESFTEAEFNAWFQERMNQLLPEFRFEPPPKLTYIRRILLGGWLDEAVIGLRHEGYWGMRILSTA